MEITPKNQSNAIDAYHANQIQERQKRVSAEPLAGGTQGLKSDTVVISDAAQRIREAQSQIKVIPDVRVEKVAELRSRIESGSYQIQPEKIADQMIRDSLMNDLFK